MELRTHIKTRRSVIRTVGLAAPAGWLAACAGVGGDTGGAATTLPPTTIEYMHYAAAGGAQAQGRDDSAKKFMATAPNITVTVTAIAPSGTMLEKFKTTAAGGTPPDVLTLPTTWYGDLVPSKMLAELDPLIKSRGQGFQKDAFYPDVLSVLQSGGKLYGVPRFVVTSVLYYNKDLFARQGIAAPNENWTWEKDFVEAGQKLSRTADGNQYFAIDYAANDIRDSAIFAWGNNYFDNALKKATLDDAKGLAALQYVYDHRWKTRLISSPEAEKAMPNRDMFLNGRIGMYARGNFEYGNLLAAKPQFQIGATLMPKGPAGRRQYGTTTAYGIAEGSKKKEATWEFVKWLVGDAGQQHLVNTESITPATKKGYQSPDVPADMWKVFTDAIKTAAYLPSIPKFTEVIGAINRELDEALVKDARGVADSARAAVTAANQLLA